VRVCCGKPDEVLYSHSNPDAAGWWGGPMARFLAKGGNRLPPFTRPLRYQLLVAAVILVLPALGTPRSRPPTPPNAIASDQGVLRPNLQRSAQLTSPTSTRTPFPSSTPLAWVYDNFDDSCISNERWYPQEIHLGGRDPTPVIRGDCFDFGPPDRLRQLTELNSGLHIPLVEDANEGLISYWPTCAAKEIQLVIPAYKFAGVSNAWLGLVVPNPTAGQKPIGVWVSSRFASSTAVTKIITTRNWAGSQTSSTAQDVTSELPEGLEVVLGIRFEGDKAYVSVGNLPSNELPPIEALGFPTYFAIVYSVGPGSELSAEVGEIRVVPVAQTSKCRLPAVTPGPATTEPPSTTPPPEVSSSPTGETPTPEARTPTPTSMPVPQPPQPDGWIEVLKLLVNTVTVLLASPLQCVVSATIVILLSLLVFLAPREARKRQVQGGNESMPNATRPSSPWASGSFYLVALVVIFLSVVLAFKMVPPWAIPLVIIAVVLLLTIIGAFVLKSMPGFTNESFLKLMAMVYRQVPLILGRKDKDDGKGDDQPDT